MFCLYSGLNFSSSDLLLEPLLSANRQHTAIRLANWIPGQKLLLSSSYSSISIFQQCTRQLYLYSCLIYLDPTTTSISSRETIIHQPSSPPALRNVRCQHMMGNFEVVICSMKCFCSICKEWRKAERWNSIAAQVYTSNVDDVKLGRWQAGRMGAAWPQWVICWPRGNSWKLTSVSSKFYRVQHLWNRSFNAHLKIYTVLRCT